MKKKSKSLNQLISKYQKDDDFKAAFEERSFYLQVAHLVRDLREGAAKKPTINSKKTGVKEIEKKYGSLTFGVLLKAHRLGEDISQANFAKQLVMSKQALNKLENGRSLPSLRHSVIIAKKIGLLPDLVVQIVLQDQIRKENLKLVVSVKRTLNKAP